MKTILTISFLLLVNFCFGCRCKQVSLEESIKGTDFIATGKVIELMNESAFPGTDKSGNKVKVQLYKFFKGQSSTDTIIVDSGLSSCSINFTLGQDYLFYCYTYSGEFKTDLCTRTAELKNNKDIELLEKE